MWRSTWTGVGGRPVRSLSAGIARKDGSPELVIVPGLGALGYLAPLVRACAGWTRVHLLDVPGFGHRSTARCPAALDDVTATVSAWLTVATAAPVLLVGHSTGAQAALQAALAAPHRVAGLALAGATFPPEARRLRPLAARVARTLPHERLAELPAVLPEYVRGNRRLARLLVTALRDRPEDHAPRWSGPLLVLRGQHDAVCSRDWAQDLAAAAPRGRCVTVPGAHNFPFTQPGPASAALQQALGGSGHERA
jgi:pimeloyl-ACP methyl ester carboxylesterase